MQIARFASNITDSKCSLSGIYFIFKNSTLDVKVKNHVQLLEFSGLEEHYVFIL